jgi:hypothetical protein
MPVRSRRRDPAGDRTLLGAVSSPAVSSPPPSAQPTAPAACAQILTTIDTLSGARRRCQVGGSVRAMAACQATAPRPTRIKAFAARPMSSSTLSGCIVAQTRRRLSSIPASPRQMEVTSGMRTVWRISTNTTSVSPPAFASAIAVTGWYAKSGVMRRAFPQVQGSLRRQCHAADQALDRVAPPHPIRRADVRRPSGSRRPRRR